MIIRQNIAQIPIYGTLSAIMSFAVITVKRNIKHLFWTIIIISLLLSLGVAYVAPAIDRQSPPPLVINEFVVSNGTGLTDEDGDTPDWIELYNRGTQPINLSDWTLTDDPSDPERWSFPDLTLPAGEYIVVFASGKNRRPTEAGLPLHTNFRLDKDGDFLGLYRILDQRFVDKIEPRYPAQNRDLAYGRIDDIPTYGFLDPPTPGQANDASKAWKDAIAPVEFSVKRGFFDSPFSVVLTTTAAGATIRYTLDGSEPTEEQGQVYTKPIFVETTATLRAAAFKSGLLPNSSQTNTYIFSNDVIHQPPNPPGFPAGADYEMDPRIVNDPSYGPNLPDALTAIPSMSIVTDIKNLDIYQNPMERGVEWERPVSVEFIDPANAARNFQINAGARIQGGVGRLPVNPKHSFRLFFKSIYGLNKLEQPLFSDSAVTSFDTLILRGGVNRTYAGFINEETDPEVIEMLRKTTYTRDQWLRESQIAMSNLGSHGLFVHLYLNGLYWGLYNLVERPDASFTSAYLGGNKEAWYAGNPDGTVSGDPVRFDALHNLAAEDNLVDPENYTKIESLLDIEQFSDYVILNFYAGNVDWGHNNWYAGNQNPNGQVKYFVWDGERIWFDGAKTYLGKEKVGSRSNLMMRLFNALVKNKDFRVTFADRLFHHLSGAGVLTDSSSIARWRAINGPIEKAIIAESARWGDTAFAPPLTQADWRRAYEDVVKQMEGNSNRLIALARQAGYYPSVDPPVFNQPGGSIEPAFELTMSHPSIGGTSGEKINQLAENQTSESIYYTLNGVDPRQPVTGEIAPDAYRYHSPIPLTTTTHVKARLYADGEWSALNEATFYTVKPPGQLLITELMYNPREGGDYEFIELKNNGDTDLDLANATFQGIRFTFPPNTPPLPPGEFVVLVRNKAAFTEKYPNVAVAGVYEGQLSNAGEMIALREPTGAVIASVAYGDDTGWPVSPDGYGDSLTLVNPSGDPNVPQSWQASKAVGGSPGRNDNDEGMLQ